MADLPMVAVVAAAVCLVALVVTGLAARWLLRSRRRMARVRSTTGVVVYSGSRSSGSHGNQPLTELRLAFLDDAQVAREGTWVGQDVPFQTNVPVGARLQLRYDPEEPTWVLPQGRTDPVVKAVVTIGLSTFVAAVAAVVAYLAAGPLRWVGEMGPVGPG